MDRQNPLVRKTAVPIVGCLLLVVGIALVLAWWPHVVGFFKGVLGMALALAGLFFLTLVKD